MDKKEFVFPGIVLGLVLVIAIGLLLTQGNDTKQVGALGMGTSTMATSSGTATLMQSHDPSSGSHAGITHYYPYGTTVLSLNQVAGFKNAVSIRPVAILEDSRCPAGVQCIQAGTVKVSLRTGANGATVAHTIALGETVTVSGLRITLESVAPVRGKENAPAAGEYRFTFTVEPAS